jgi:hypothetical protein
MQRRNSSLLKTGIEWNAQEGAKKSGIAVKGLAV